MTEVLITLTDPLTLGGAIRFRVKYAGSLTQLLEVLETRKFVSFKRGPRAVWINSQHVLQVEAAT